MPGMTSAFIRDLAQQIAAAIERRDTAALRPLLAPGFTQRSIGGATADADQFLAGIAGIPGEITFVRLESLDVDLFPNAAMATGIQHAQVIVEGQVIDDRRIFIDWFVNDRGNWRLQAAVDIEQRATPAGP